MEFNVWDTVIVKDFLSEEVVGGVMFSNTHAEYKHESAVITKINEWGYIFLDVDPMLMRSPDMLKLHIINVTPVDTPEQTKMKDKIVTATRKIMTTPAWSEAMEEEFNDMTPEKQTDMIVTEMRGWIVTFLDKFADSNTFRESFYDKLETTTLMVLHGIKLKEKNKFVMPEVEVMGTEKKAKNNK